MPKKHRCLPLLLMLFSALTFSNCFSGELRLPTLPRTLPIDQDFLPVDEAFAFSLEHHGETLKLKWQIAEGHYLYRDRLSVRIGASEVELAGLPKGESVEDPYFGQVQVYRSELVVPVAIKKVAQGQISVSYQGCAVAGLCYPVQVRVQSL